MHWKAILVAALLVFAGCTGTTGSDDAGTDTTTETPTETPTETTRPAPTLDDVEFPPGVSETGVSADLLTAHTLSLSGESFTVDVETTVNGDASVTTIRVADGTALATTATPRGERVAWTNGSGTYSRATENGETSYAVGAETFDRERFSQTRRMETFVEAGAYEPTEVVVRNGTPLVRIEATGLDDATTIERQYGADSVESFDATLLVDEDGRIREMRTSLTLVRGDGTVTQSTTITTHSVGETTVERPDWTATAAEQATTVDVSRTDDGEFVAIEHTGGSAIEAGAFLTLSIASDDSHYDTQLETDLEEGETLYLYVENGRLQQSVGERPADADPATLSGFIHVSAYAGGQQVFGVGLRG